MGDAAILEFNDANFEQEVLKSDQPVLVDFTAVWCPPCKMLNPTVEKIARDYVGKAKVGKFDADGNREMLIKYKIEALPTVIIFRDGQPTHQFRGLRQERDYRDALDSNA